MRSREEIPRLREFPRVLASEAALPVGDCTAKFQRLAAVTRMRVIINREVLRSGYFMNRIDDKQGGTT